MIVTFLTHSAFAVELDRSVLIFDYFQGKLPDFGSQKDIYFFASHKHGDHYHPRIFEFAEKWEHVHYILSKEIRIPGAVAKKQPLSVLHMKKDETVTLGDVRIWTLRSTDLGVAYLVEAEGTRIYHAGDLNWWHWDGEDRGWNYQMEQNYKKEMEKIRGKHFHLAFLPVDPRLGEAYYLGVKAFSEVAKADKIFPMHFWGEFDVCTRLKTCPQTADLAACIVSIQKENEQWRY